MLNTCGKLRKYACLVEDQVLKGRVVVLKVLFLCTGNSCRSQMAEGFGREYGRGLIEAHSAGLLPAGVNPYAIKVMNEVGIDISGQTSKAIEAKILGGMDVIITLCGHAERLCPVTPPESKRLHWPIDDPVGTVGTEEKILSEFRRARDELLEKIKDFVLLVKNGQE